MSKQQKSTASKPVTVVEFDGIDSLMFDSIRDARKVAEICADNDAEGVVQDAFTSFFSHEPKIADDSEPVQAGVVEQMFALPEFSELRAGTQNDEISSALATVQFAPEMITKIVELRKKMKERQEQAKQDGKPSPQNLKEALSENEMSGLRQSLRRSLEKAQKESDQWGDVAAGWGLDKGELKNLPAEKRMKLADTLSNSKKMKRIADLAGRFKNIVNSSAATVPVHGLDEVVDIGISGDVAHMLPTELIKLIETPDLFYSDLIEGKLLTYNLKGVEPMGQGPILCCLDLSGSMDGLREEWSKAVILSLLQLAQKQKRAFGYIGFDSSIQISKFFPRGEQITIQDKIQIAEVFSGGGTEFFQPLKKAFDMRAMDPSLKPADIIFITDGDCHMGSSQLEEILQLKKKTDMRIYSIGIDCHNTNTLESFSDQVAGVSLNGDVQIDLIKDLVSKTASQKVGGVK
jgi:uncharacterized protein with von Willebrand factor type A (vWA) domain